MSRAMRRDPSNRKRNKTVGTSNLTANGRNDGDDDDDDDHDDDNVDDPNN